MLTRLLLVQNLVWTSFEGLKGLPEEQSKYKT